MNVAKELKKDSNYFIGQWKLNYYGPKAYKTKTIKPTAKVHRI